MNITDYAWVKRCDGEYILYAVGGPAIGWVERTLDGWFIFRMNDFAARLDPLPTRKAAGRWLVEQWEAQP